MGKVENKTPPRERPKAAKKKRRAATPVSREYHRQPAILVGTVDVLLENGRSFGLRLDDGNQAIIRILNKETVVVGQRVVVSGKALFDFDFRMVSVDGSSIESGEGVTPLFSKLPRCRHRPIRREDYIRPQGPDNGINAIIGKWPGDETEEELLRALREIRG